MQLPTTAVPAFTAAFILAVAIALLLRLWLGLRQMHHVARHREAVPPMFADRISPEAHRTAADYTLAKTRLGLLDTVAGTLLLIALTLGGGLDTLARLLAGHFPPDSLLFGLGLFAGLGIIGFVIDLPFGLYRTFVIEARFGFNKTTLALFLSDLAKQLLLTVLIGGPLLAAVLWLMARMGDAWWLWVWLFWLGFNLLAMVLYPTWIAPLFNTFKPLENDVLKVRIEALLNRCGFRSSGLFVMDGSRRSAHGNAYFTGFGAAKRIVFFDTLLERLDPPEIEAVLAHELGHFKCRHVWKRVGFLAILSLAFLWSLAQLIHQPWFYDGLGLSIPGTASALALFSLVLPVFTFPLAPLLSALSRHHEFEADDYARQTSDGQDLARALVKLYRDNAATLTPDPIHSAFYDSHPPAALRLARLAPR